MAPCPYPLIPHLCSYLQTNSREEVNSWLNQLQPPLENVRCCMSTEGMHIVVNDIGQTGVCMLSCVSVALALLPCCPTPICNQCHQCFSALCVVHA